MPDTVNVFSTVCCKNASSEEVASSPSQQPALPLHCWDTKSRASLDFTQQHWLRRLGKALMVPSFFALSGYLLYRNYTTEKLLGKLKSRIFSLLIPYLIWNLAAYLFYQIIRFVPGVTESMNHSGADFSVMDMFADMLCGGRNVTWFIRFLLGFCMVAPIAWYCIKTLLLGALSLVLLIVAGMTLNFNFLSYLAIFLFGGWIGVNWPDKVREKYSTRVRCLSLLLLLSTVLAETIYSSTSGGAGKIYSFGGVRFVCYGLSQIILLLDDRFHRGLRFRFFSM